ncbi:mRNA-capping enzyme subunit alpha [Wickerhamomyces ciferrii]|uniref:mRNA-capping enzyme subunit alpha n=1 Tax=Wickerhamomyces ciferrii (strain ATCC 14091 / BCRC 22168 / CBS 111 / JCM 3599 / NBRC 0793 / NRRL Y-1031 F-60-10) TaxID=1206466 RepID=K0KR78_WICCF|nr:mRNA-capping enzyme subunit alpha [Wickerhamomyces ciferrii]CCH45661.1 mRNA-capping enzyme subunit alpha [Wickerhamomyces ciferrii]
MLILEERDMPEIPGELMPDHIAHELKNQVARLLNRRKLEFPGSQPISFESNHITENLINREYFVCEKSDGLRCLMLCILDPLGDEAVFLITRENQYFRIPNFHFPLPEDENSCHNGTLIDGELVISKNPNGIKELRYFMFDCLTLNGQNIVMKPLPKRLGYLGENFYKPYFHLRSKHPKECESFPFKLSLKNMQPAFKLPQVFESLKHLGHVSDGLIFTSCETPYVYGTDPTLLKWKPSEENTVDFRLHLNIPMYTDEDLDERDPYRSYPNYEVKPNFELMIWEGKQSYSNFAELIISDEEWENLKNLNQPLEERVVECNKDKQDNWNLLRFRDDKLNGNHISIVEKVLKSIKDGVTKEELIANAANIEHASKQREFNRKSRQGSFQRPPSSSQPQQRPPPQQQNHNHNNHHDEEYQQRKRPSDEDDQLPTYEDEEDSDDNEEHENKKQKV